MNSPASPSETQGTRAHAIDRCVDLNDSAGRTAGVRAGAVSAWGRLRRHLATLEAPTLSKPEDRRLRSDSQEHVEADRAIPITNEAKALPLESATRFHSVSTHIRHAVAAGPSVAVTGGHTERAGVRR